MPGFDRSGPTGQGSRTGRNMGKCRPANRDNNDVATDERPRRRWLNNPTNEDNTSRRLGGRGRRQRGGF